MCQARGSICDQSPVKTLGTRSPVTFPWLTTFHVPCHKNSLPEKLSASHMTPLRENSGSLHLVSPGLWPIPTNRVAQSCLTLCNPMDCSLPGSAVHGIFQAIVLEWVAISFSKGSSWPRDRTCVSHIVDRCFTIWATPFCWFCSVTFSCNKSQSWVWLYAQSC